MILLNYGDLKLKGDCKIEEHEDWIQCESIQFGVGRSITQTMGGSDRETSNPSFSDVNLNKMSDISSVDLMMESAGGTQVDKAIIHLVNTAEQKAQVYMTIELENPILSSYSASSGGDRPSESISLNFTKITYGYNQWEKGKTQKKIGPKSWNLSLNKAE